MACGLRFYGDGISFWVIFSQSFWLRVLPGGACLVQPRWMPERRILGGGQASGVSFWPFPNSSGWWRVISSVFLARTACHKTPHANGYYSAWPVWRFQISMFPLRSLELKSENSEMCLDVNCGCHLWGCWKIFQGYQDFAIGRKLWATLYCPQWVPGNQ